MIIKEIIDILNKINKFCPELNTRLKWQIIKSSKVTLKNLNDVHNNMFKVAINTILNQANKENINTILLLLKMDQPFPELIDEFLNNDKLSNDIYYIRDALFLFKSITNYEKSNMLYNILTNQKLIMQYDLEGNNKAIVLANSFTYYETNNLVELKFLMSIINDDFFDYYDLNTYFTTIIEDVDEQKVRYSKTKIKEFLNDNNKLKELIIHLYNSDYPKEEKLEYYNFLINIIQKCKKNMEIIKINSDINVNKDNYCNYLFSLLFYYTEEETEELHEVNVRKLELS